MSSPLIELRGVPDVLKLILALLFLTNPTKKPIYYKWNRHVCWHRTCPYVEALKILANYLIFEQPATSWASPGFSTKFCNSTPGTRIPRMDPFLEEGPLRQPRLCRPLPL
jgi:hypothetical protein